MPTSRPTKRSVTIHDPSKSFGGYTLFSPHGSTDVWLIDMEGRPVHHWQMPSQLGSDVRLLPNGNQLRVSKTYDEPSAFLGTVGSQLLEVDWDGNVVWRHHDPAMHHDLKRLEGGNTMLNRHVRIPAETAARVKGGIPGTERPDGMWGNAYREITPDGQAVWEWNGHEHLDPDVDVPCPLCPRSIWGYVNGIDVFPNGDVIGSFRHLNNLIITDRVSGNIKWRWGRWELGHQHNPTVLDNGNILVFDNGFHRLPPYEERSGVSAGSYSRVLEVNPATDEIEWQYQPDPPSGFWSAVCSSAQRLDNGNTFICESTSGRLFEVTPAKEIVWEYTSPFFARLGRYGLTNMVFKAHRYPPDFEGLRGRDLDPDRAEWTLRDRLNASG